MSHHARPSFSPVWVIVVAYGSEDLLEECLQDLDGSFPTVVVDNGQSERARGVATGAGAEYVRLPTNVGFAAAVNEGLARAPKGADVLLLNPDARVSPETVSRLCEALHATSAVAAVAPRLRR